nr:MAG TPA: hypothetical protein [Caudoviricetes sp.]
MEKIMLAVMRFFENGLSYLITALMAIEMVANLCKGNFAGVAFFGVLTAMMITTLRLGGDGKEDKQ